MNWGTNHSGRDADTFENVWNQAAIPLMAEARPYLMACIGRILGPDNPMRLAMAAENPPNGPMMERLFRLPQVAGKAYQVRLLGETEDWEILGRDFASLAAPVTPTFTENRGVAQFNPALLHKDMFIDIRRWAEAEGGHAKGDKPEVEEARKHAEGLASTMSTGLHSTDDVADNAIGGHLHALNSTGSYGGLSRTDILNANYVAQQQNTAGAQSLAQCRRSINKAKIVGGRPSIVPCTFEQYSDIQDIVDTENVPNENNDLQWLKGEHLRIGPATFVLDADKTDETRLSWIDHRQVRIVLFTWPGNKDMNLAGFERNRNFKGILHGQVDLLFQQIFMNPKLCTNQYGLS